MSQATPVAKNLPAEITSYDLLKTFAVIIMVIDHAGFYFFPDDLWWRAIGRIGFPIWFFLIGYSSGRDIPQKLIWSAVILTLGNIVAGMPLFPLNALITIALIRVIIARLMSFALVNETRLWLCAFILVVLIAPSYVLCEYGTLGLITAMFGYMVRHKEKIANDQMIIRFMIFALVVFIGVQQLVFNFTTTQFAFMAMGTTLVRISLFYFQSRAYPDLTDKCPSLMRQFIQFCGRRTLEIYVVHLMMFKFIALGLGLEGYRLLAWKWLPLE